MAENLVPSNISQGVNIPRAERVKPSFLGKLEERFGSRKAPLDAEQETHAKEKVGIIGEGKALMDKAKGHMSAETAAVAARDQAGQTETAKVTELSDARLAGKNVGRLFRAIQKGREISAEDVDLLDRTANGQVASVAEMATLAKAIIEARAQQAQHEQALTAARGEEPNLSLNREQGLSEKAEEHQIRQVAHGERILAILSGSEGGQPTIDDLKRAAAICDSLTAEGKTQAKLLNKVAQSLGERYPDQKDEIDALRAQISGEVATAREAVRVPSAEDVLGKISPEDRAGMAQDMESGATQIIRPEFQQQLRDKLGITRTETPVEGGEPTVEYGVAAGSLAERRQNATAFAQELGTAYQEAFTQAQEDPRLADLVVQLGQMRSIAESATRILDSQIQRTIKQTEVAQAAQIAKEKAGAERASWFNKQAGRIDSWINKAGRGINKVGSRTTNVLGHGVAAIGAVAMLPGAAVVGVGEGLAWVSRTLGAKAEGGMEGQFQANESKRDDRRSQLEAEIAALQAELNQLTPASDEDAEELVTA